MTINIAYACDDAYVVHTGISLISLFENNKDIEEIVIYFIDMGISQQSRYDLEQIVSDYNRTMIIIPFSRWANDLSVNNTGRHINSVYAKIFFGRILEINKILYIDSDTVIVDSIKELWNTNMQEYAIAGVETINTIVEREKIGLNSEDLVINDGVVLIDLNVWREKKFEKKCLEFIKKWNGNPPVLSEGTINSVCRGYIFKLSLRYNVTNTVVDYSSQEIKLITECNYYAQSEIDNAANNPCIIHFVSGFHKRPWYTKSTHPFKWAYIQYRNMSKWKEIPLEKLSISKKIRFMYYLHKILPYQVFVWFYKKSGKGWRKDK